MKTVNYIVSKVYKVVSGAFQLPVYNFEKPIKDSASQYIVINSLPVDADKELQTAFVNINIHVHDLDEGIPDNDALDDLTSQVFSLVDDATVDNIYFSVMSQGQETEDALNEHYSNIKVKCKILNN